MLKSHKKDPLNYNIKSLTIIPAPLKHKPSRQLNEYSCLEMLKVQGNSI
jgi:hypothetical protein